MRKSVELSFFLLGTVIASGCGGDGGNGTSPGASSGPLHATVVTADDVTNRFLQICRDPGWPAGAADFLAYAASLEQVERFSLDPVSTDVCLHYGSGVAHIFHHAAEETPPDHLEDLLTSRGAPRGAALVPSNVRMQPNWIPSQPSPAATAATSHGADEWRRYLEPACGRILDALHIAGYDVPLTVPDANVEWFRTWDNYGVIYFQGHGGWGWWYPAFDPPERLYALQTSVNYRTVDGPGREYVEDLANGYLVFFSTSSEDETRALAVTNRFFRQYANPMALHGMVYLNACNGLSYLTDMADVLCGLGTEVVFGWTGPEPLGLGAAGAVYFFDRLCGLNLTFPQTPPTRPFTANEVYAYMVGRGWDSHTTPDGRSGQLEYYRPSPLEENSASRPVISGGVFHGESELSRADLWLNGYFGRPSGQVLIGDTSLDTPIWSPFLIQAVFPRGTTDWVGDVVVRVNHLDSIPIRLTRFEGGVDIVIDRPDRYSGTITATFSGRAFLHAIREEIDGEPITMPTPTGFCLFQPETWEMTWNITGEWDDTDGLGRPVHYSLSASGTASNDSDDHGSLIQAFQLDLDASTVQRRASVDVDGILTRTDHSGTSTHSWSESYGTGGLLSSEPLPDDWDIAERTFTSGFATFNWTHIVPDVPPPPPESAYPSNK